MKKLMKNKKMYLTFYIAVFAMWFLAFFWGNGLGTPNPIDNINWIGIIIALLLIVALSALEKQRSNERKSLLRVIAGNCGLILITIARPLYSIIVDCKYYVNLLLKLLVKLV